MPSEQDLVKNEHLRVREALRDLVAFIRKHGCMVVFPPDATCYLSFNTSQTMIEQLIEVVETRWSYSMFDGDAVREGQDQQSATFAQGESESVQKQRQIQKRIDAVAGQLDPGTLLQMMTRVASGDEPEKVLEALEQKAAAVEAERKAVAENPEQMLCDFSLDNLFRDSADDEIDFNLEEDPF
jgi:hypothetical protein